MVEIAGKRVYLDANALIGYAEDHPVFGPILEEVFKSLLDGSLELVTSELTVAEVLVAPLRDNNEGLVRTYEEIIQSRRNFRLVPVSLAILKQSAHLRADLGLKLPDAIHVATAISASCQILLSEDTRMKAPSAVAICRIADLRLGKEP